MPLGKRWTDLRAHGVLRTVSVRGSFHPPTMKLKSRPVEELRWSDRLKQYTRDILRDLPAWAFINKNRMHFKSLHGAYAHLLLQDALEDRLLLRQDPDGDVVARFAGVEDLLGAGWVVD